MARRHWSSEEDQALRFLVRKHGTQSWAAVAIELNASLDTERFGVPRTNKQCRDRWHNQLEVGIRKDEWTSEEDHVLREMQARLGNAWAQIAIALPGRTDNAVKNRFNSSAYAVR
ncbi:Homeodomain-like protein [Pavlovales sp. CCMP2436]|nr:Homeodomain-like protein [Pavlovales sp. CCMP2436]